MGPNNTQASLHKYGFQDRDHNDLNINWYQQDYSDTARGWDDDFAPEPRRSQSRTPQ
jgi:hypothetical protein